MDKANVRNHRRWKNRTRVSPWSSTSFSVPKKKPGEYQLVEDLRKLNDATIDDGHALARIEDILQKQGGYKIWSALDLKDGYF